MDTSILIVGSSLLAMTMGLFGHWLPRHAECDRATPLELGAVSLSPLRSPPLSATGSSRDE